MNIAFFHPTQVLRLVIVWLTILFLFACGGVLRGSKVKPVFIHVNVCHVLPYLLLKICSN